MKYFNFRTIIKSAVFVVVVGVIALVAFSIGRQRVDAQEQPFLATSDFNAKHFKVFWETWQTIKDQYIERDKINNDKAAFEAARGLVRSINDPYSDLFNSEQGKVFKEDLSGSFSGVGMEIGERKGLVRVIAPLEGTPAERAGIKAGDAILKINGEDATNMTVEVAVSKIRGVEGTVVELELMREGWKQSRTFKVTRRPINIPAVKGKLYPGGVGHIKINTFNPKTVPEFVTVYDKLQKQGATRFVLDLRNNPGGYLEVAVQLGSLFFDRGKVVVRELWGPNKEEKASLSDGPGTLGKLKLVVLVNRGSASASEIFAGALRDNLGVKLLGERTYGKGSIQQIFTVDDNTLKLTVGYWLTPNRTKLEGKGLEADVALEDKTPDDNKDEVLDQAIQYVRTKL